MIPEVGIDNIGIGNVGIGQPNITSVFYIAEPAEWMTNPSVGVPPAPPVTVDIGSPVVNIPGCVETHKENLERPPNKNESLVNDDPRQSVVLCDAGMPAYAPMDYDTRRLKIEDLTPPPEEEEYQHRGGYGGDGAGGAGAVGEPPDTKQPDPPEDPPCPGPNAQRIGDVAQNQTEKVSGFELQVDPRNPDGVKICVTLYEDIGAVEQFLPTPQVAATTATIAVVATSSALLAKPLADLLLKVVKPAVKKIIGKIQKLMGKKEKVLSLQERKLKQKEANAGAKAARLLKGK